jgi:hypothetical protein
MNFQPYGFCLVTDVSGSKAVAHVPRDLCVSGYTTDQPPLATFKCSPAEDDAPAESRRGTRGAMNCRVLPGQWVQDAVEVQRAGNDPNGPVLCWKFTDSSVLADTTFSIPGARQCTDSSLA